MLVLFASFARVSQFFFLLSLPRIQKRWVVIVIFHSFRLLPTTYYNYVNGERTLLTGISFSFFIAGLHMSREIMLKWCKTKPTIESEYVRALFESCDDHVYIYMIYIYDLLRKISIIIVSIFQIPKKNRKVKINPPSSATSHWPPSEFFFDLHLVRPKDHSKVIPCHPPSIPPFSIFPPPHFSRKNLKILHSHPTSTIPCKICELPPSPQIRILLIDLLRFSPPNPNEEEEEEGEKGGGGRRET